MTARPHEHPWKAAHRIAEAHGMYLVSVTERGHSAYVLYRRNPHGPRDTRIGRRRDYRGVLALVKRAAGVAGEPGRPLPEDHHLTEETAL